ncbi:MULTISPECIES: type II toxin-antitoxin system VapC family toxin [unclassified Brevibacterium]|uniref:type II toxin-antitoxin system VapC family toxin n=1 Tax=unclassified Brevibacterium TaxID=2614124 RepID=UPI001092E367|nr:type II toxin-antitoxin system VapC family toxin [Brevibacterium sp. S22]TGD32659.1 type II toxin-antitoxin system VapC family toxin [Brevibacterium sp. S22]
MILVDTSVWIDHLHRADPLLQHLLEIDEVGSHSAVVEELALGTLKSREEVLNGLEALFRFPDLAHEELMSFISMRSLWGRGLSAADVHLLGSALVVDGARLWTRDKRLVRAAEEVGRDFAPSK